MSVKDWLFGPSCRVYVACKMTSRDKAEMHRRAKFVCEVFAAYGLKAVSPVLEEQIKDEPGRLVNHDKELLHSHWKRDKDIVRYETRVTVLDHAEMKSFGMEREYGLNRYCLWKPTLILIPQGTPLSVAQFEDDQIFYSAHSLAAYVSAHWGSRWSYWRWRLMLLIRKLPRFVFDQFYQWVV